MTQPPADQSDSPQPAAASPPDDNAPGDNARNQSRWRVDPVMAGTCFGIFAAVTYTGANMALRQLVRHNDPDWAVWVACVKAMPAALAAWAIIAYRGMKGLQALPPRALVLPLLLTGLFMQFGGNVAFQWALSLGGLALTVPLMFATLISSSALLGRIVLSEPISARATAAMGVLIVAICVLSGGADIASRAMDVEATRMSIVGAVVFACSAGFAYGACGVVMRRTVTSDVSLSATLVLLSSSGVIGLGLTSLWRLGPEQLLQTPSDDMLMMGLAGLFNAVAFFSLCASLRYISVLRVNLLNASQIAMAAAAGVVCFDEQLTVWLIGGTILTATGLVISDKA